MFQSYRMIGMPRGQALIINVNEVSEKPPRRGTDIDRDNLHNLLTQLHFQVTIYNDNDDLTALVSVSTLCRHLIFLSVDEIPLTDYKEGSLCVCVCVCVCIIKLSCVLLL